MAAAFLPADELFHHPKMARKRYQAMDGMSMATPDVAGIVALLVEAKPAATARQLHAALVTAIAGDPPLRHGAGWPRPVVALSLL